MKRLLSMLLIFAILFVFAGCTDTSETTAPTTPTTVPTTPSTTEAPEEHASPEYTLVDYTITPQMNATYACFATRTGGSTSNIFKKVDPSKETATAVKVELTCPYCGEFSYDVIEFSEIPENLIGLQQFTWTDKKKCLDWYEHNSDEDPSYQYSILFTLN